MALNDGVTLDSLLSVILLGWFEDALPLNCKNKKYVSLSILNLGVAAGK